MERAGLVSTLGKELARTSPSFSFLTFLRVALRGSLGAVWKEVGSNQVVEKQECEKSVVVSDRTTTFKDLCGKAWVGRAVDLETLVDFHRLLRITRTDFSNIQYLGGLSILISFSDEFSAKKFLDSREVRGPWFSKLVAWEGQSLPIERVVWLMLYGVPLHLLDLDVLKMVGELFGKVLHVQISLVDEKDMSVNRVGVLAGKAQRIKENVKVKWKNKNYRIWVEEEQDEWIPDC
ncbi:hypothetical protein HanPI659440_Chr17g0690501 [Helianthus annuus]|nr:hypothetical protein HanPI659440_Chr17g0690501 [Helianthus annuus]